MNVERPCPACGTSLRGEFRFCPSCGSSVPPPPELCASCGAALVPGARFCAACGTPAGTGVPAATAFTPPPPEPAYTPPPAPPPPPAYVAPPARPEPAFAAPPVPPPAAPREPVPTFVAPPSPAPPVPMPAPVSAAPACIACGAALAQGDMFCQVCGASQDAQAAPVAAAAEPVMPVCISCGGALRPGARFCKQCGASQDAPAPAAGAARPQAFGGPRPAAKPQAFGSPHPAPAAAPRQRTYQPPPPVGRAGTPGLTIATIVAGAGMALALLSPFLAWASASGTSTSGIDGDFPFRFSDWLDTETAIDAYLVLVLAAAGLVLVGLGMAGRIPSARATVLAASVGGALGAIGAIEAQYVFGFDAGRIDLSPGIGVYMLIAAGVASAIAPVLPSKPLGGG